MTRRELTRDEAAKLAASVHQMYGYLRRLHDRMTAAGIDVGACAKVEGAANAAHGLWVHLHYASCRKANDFDLLDRLTGGSDKCGTSRTD